MFYRGDEDVVGDIRNLRGKRIAIGPAGSGTQAVAIATLFENRDLRLMKFGRHASYTQRIGYLSTVQLNQGVLDLASNVPAEDATLVAPAATLMGHEDIHPGIAELITKASREIFGKGDVLEEPGEFPSIQRVGDVPMDETAERIIVDGPSFLSEYLPFWALSLIRRLKLLLIGLVPILVIASKIAPAVYKWRMGRKVYGWYAQLRLIEEAVAKDGREVAAERLEKLQKEMKAVTVPTTYWKEVYNLRLHIDLVAREIAASR